MKRCKKCNQEKPLESFPKDKRYRGGYKHWCKSCKYEYDRQWLKSDPEHQVRANSATERWYAEKGKEYHAEWRDKNREKTREINARYRANNLEKRRESYRRRRKVLRDTTSDITVEWLVELRTATPDCELCGVELTDTRQHEHSKANLDHIIPLNIGGTHTRDNVRYICYLCNLGRPKDGSDITTFSLPPSR